MSTFTAQSIRLIKLPFNNFEHIFARDEQVRTRHTILETHQCPLFNTVKNILFFYSILVSKSGREAELAEVVRKMGKKTSWLVPISTHFHSGCTLPLYGTVTFLYKHSLYVTKFIRTFLIRDKVYTGQSLYPLYIFLVLSLKQRIGPWKK